MRPLVLVHGFMGGRMQWQDQVQALGMDRKVITVTLPGFADRNTEPAIDTIAGFASSVLLDLDKQNIGQFDLLGHSMGGMVVQEMIRLAADRIGKLLLYGTGAVGILPGRFETIEQSKSRARQEGLQATARRIAGTWFLVKEQAPAYESCAAIAEKTSSAAFDGGLDAMQNWSGEANLPTIASDTLVIWGDRDRTYPWAQTQLLWQSIHGAGLAVVPGCAHAVHLEKPEIFNAIVTDFLNS